MTKSASKAPGDKPAGQVIVAIEGHVATLTLSNPARRNAISVGMWQAIRDFAKVSHERGDIRVVVMRGEGTLAFSAGADISDFAAARGGVSNARAYDDLVEETCCAVEAMPCPSIALLHGACFGAGASLAASCDLRIAAAGAYLAVPAARLGLGYDPRGIARFLRVMGQPVTRYLLMSAERLTVERAAATGAIIEVAPAEEIDAKAAALAQRIAGNAPLTLAAAKLALRAHAGDDPALLGAAMKAYEAADASEDYAEGRAAFAAKRPPRFKGK